MTQKYQAVKTQVRMQEWMELVSAQKQSGLTVKQWCEENGIAVGTYYYWLDKLREAAVNEMAEPVLTEVNADFVSEDTAGPIARIIKSGVDVTIYGSITTRQMKALLKAL